ncbi:MAG: hypothetical protein AB8B94_19685 [Hyphomicrobiales bacterium]
MKRVILALLLALPTSQSHAYEINDLVSAHYRCNALFDQKSLSDDETHICADLNEQLKLHFVDGVDWEIFGELSDEEKSSVSQQGYLRFKAWERSNLELVKQLETEAIQSIEIN